MTDLHNDRDNDKLSALYKSLSDEKPSAFSDEEILKLAEKTAQMQRQTSWIKTWSAPISVAAVVVISVSIVSVIKNESISVLSTITPAIEPAQNRPITRKIPQQKQPIKQDLEFDKPEKITLALTIDSALKNPIDSRLNKIAAPAKGETAAVRHQSSRMKTTAIPKHKAATPLIRERKTVNEPSVAARVFIPKRSTAKQVYESTVEPFAVQSFLPKPKTVDHSRVCAKTSHAKCLESMLCILVKAQTTDGTTNMRCIEADNQCEKNFSQSDSNAEQCLEKQNCWYRPGMCECDENSKCNCDKMGPAMCVPDS